MTTTYPGCSPRVAAANAVNEEDLEWWCRLIRHAHEHHDGHFTVMKFTGNWRVCFGTPNEVQSWDGEDLSKGSAPDDDGPDINDCGLRGFIHTMPEGATFAEAARAALEADGWVDDGQRYFR